MGQKKKGRKIFQWLRRYRNCAKCDLPDNNANTQVLLLGVTRLDTPIRNLKSKTSKTDKSNCFEARINDVQNSDNSNALKSKKSFQFLKNRKFRSLFDLNQSNCNDLEKIKFTKCSNEKLRSSLESLTKQYQLISDKSFKNIQSFFGKIPKNCDKRLEKSEWRQTVLSNSSPTIYHLVDTKAYENDVTNPLLQQNARPNEKWFNCGKTERPPTSGTGISPNASKLQIVKSKLKRNKRKKTGRLSACIANCGSRNESCEPESLTSSFRINPEYYYISNNQNNPNKSNNNNIKSKSNNNICNKFDRKQSSDLKLINQSINDRHKNNNYLLNNLNIMDRSVDSIGSCSLDVDAESTDFSDTSGSLNVCTPLSGKDFTREFTSRIHERCQPLQGQQTTTILDPNSGKISTILSISSSINPDSITTPSITTALQSSPVKKPSYLNLACCVNGYSNLTTYDSKFRQSINKSREVSPIRPITHTVQYNRGDNNYLVVPVSVPINDSRNSFMMDSHTILSPEKRYFTAAQQKTMELTTSGHDVTDNVNTNGTATFFKKTVVCKTSTSRTILKEDTETNKSTKSFIQQRVERLYGPGALAQGLYSPKKPKCVDESSTNVSSILAEKSQNSSNTIQMTRFSEQIRNGHHVATTSITTTGNSAASADLENVNVNALHEALPVLRHLRPEFRAQLPTLSPKRSVNTITTTKLSPSNQYVHNNNGPINGRLTDIYNKNASNSQIIANGNGVVISNDSNNKQSSNVYNDNMKNASPQQQDKNSLTSKYQSKAECHKYNNSNNNNNSITNGNNNAGVTEAMNSVNRMKLTDNSNSSQCEFSSSTLSSEQAKPIEASTMAAATASAPTINPKLPLNSVAVCSSIKSIENVVADSNGNHKTEQEKDAPYFLSVVKSERDRLIDLAVFAEKEMENLIEKGETEEEVLGYLRSAAGKARLLATQKFKQFEGLCNNSLNQISNDAFPPPTPQDLQGFWDMVCLQVSHVESLFVELETFKANNWKKPAQESKKAPPQGTKLTKRPILSRTTNATSGTSTANKSTENGGATKKSAASIAAAQKREAQRKQLLEMKRKNKMAMASGPNANVNDTEVIVQSNNSNISDSQRNNNASNGSDVVHDDLNEIQDR